MPQPLFIQCLTLNLYNDTEQDDIHTTNIFLTPEENEIDRFFHQYEAKIEETYNTPRTKNDIKAKTSPLDGALLPEAQKNIRHIVETWHQMLTNPENQIDHRHFKYAIQTLPLPQTQPQYYWTKRDGLVKGPRIVTLRINEFLYQEMLETMHTKFHALSRCNAPDCNAFFIQQGRKDPQIFCSSPCRSRIHKRQSRERKNQESPRKK